MKIEALTIDEFRDLYHRLYNLYNYEFKLKDVIHYFSWDDLCFYTHDKHAKSLRLITAYDDKEILGICLFAWWDYDNHYSMSYLSTNNKHFGKGISKKLANGLFEYFSKTYPNETLYFSGYSVDGWKYLHPTVLKMSKLHNVKIKEKALDFVLTWTDESRKLFDESRKEIKKLYPEYYIQLGYN